MNNAMIFLCDDRRQAAGSIFFKRTGKGGGYSALRRRKSVLILPLLGPLSFGWYSNPQESGGAWVAQVLVWAPGAFIHWTHVLVW